jgi:hypothetical protein
VIRGPSKLPSFAPRHRSAHRTHPKTSLLLTIEFLSPRACAPQRRPAGPIQGIAINARLHPKLYSQPSDPHSPCKPCTTLSPLAPLAPRPRPSLLAHLSAKCHAHPAPAGELASRRSARIDSMLMPCPSDGPINPLLHGGAFAVPLLIHHPPFNPTPIGFHASLLPRSIHHGLLIRREAAIPHVGKWKWPRTFQTGRHQPEMRNASHMPGNLQHAERRDFVPRFEPLTCDLGSTANHAAPHPPLRSEPPPRLTEMTSSSG